MSINISEFGSSEAVFGIFSLINSTMKSCFVSVIYPRGKHDKEIKLIYFGIKYFILYV